MADVDVARCIADLSNSDHQVREAAREALVELGADALGPLHEALRDDRRVVQWEAAKALISIGDPSSAASFAEATEDNDLDIRWLASEGLVNLGQAGLEALLKRLCTSESSRGHHAAQVVIRRFTHVHGEALAPLLEALRGKTADTPIMVAASAALTAVRATD